MAHFGRSITNKPKRTGLWIGIAAAALAATAIVLIVALTGKDDPAVAAKPDDTPTPTPVAAPTNANVGFDLYIKPPGLVVQWKLDDEVRSERLPSQIRGIKVGTHTVVIDPPPPGFLPKTQKITVTDGKPAVVEIALEPLPNLTGSFTTTPAGVTVTLIVDGERTKPIGVTPIKTPLDPRKSYLVLYEKAGYVSLNRTVRFTGRTEEVFEETLQKIDAVAAKPPDNIKPPDIKPPDIKPPDVKPPDIKPPDIKPPDVKPPDTKPKGNGLLALGAKPPCEIFVDGVATGLYTPQPKLPLSAGRHRIVLVNNEFGIRESIVVDIKPDETTRVFKDLSDRLPK